MAANDNVDQSLLAVLAARGRNAPPVDPPGGGGDDGGMEARLAKIEAVLPTLATKADVAEVKVAVERGINETQRWMIATVIGLFIGFGGLFLAMSNALKPAAAPAAQPSVFVVPGAQPATPAGPAASKP